MSSVPANTWARAMSAARCAVATATRFRRFLFGCP